MPSGHPSWRGRGAAQNPANRFETIRLERDDSWDPAQDPAPRTQFLRDASQTIITYNDSPDVGFSASVNPYRGCEHGCIYCYARPTHEYLGFSAGLDFETRILVKDRAPELLQRELASPKWKPQVLAFSGVTDCYQPVERRLGLTRRCLAVLAAFRNPVAVVTKNRLVTRDLDLLGALARHQAATLMISVTTLDADLATRLEARATLPDHRLAAITAAARAGIPIGVLAAPVIPGLTDHELPAILKAAAQAGAQFASYVMLRLPHGVGGLFEDWLERHFPNRKNKVLSQLRAVHGGHLTEQEFGTRMRGRGRLAEHIARLFKVARRQAGLASDGPPLSIAAFAVPGDGEGSRPIQEQFSF